MFDHITLHVPKMRVFRIAEGSRRKRASELTGKVHFQRKGRGLLYEAGSFKAPRYCVDGIYIASIANRNATHLI